MSHAFASYVIRERDTSTGFLIIKPLTVLFCPVAANQILDTIRRLGSMHAAAAKLQMSYRVVWMRIRISEERNGKPLVVRQGKGSQLAPFAESLMKQFKRLHALVEAESDEVYKSLMSDYLTHDTQRHH